MVDLRLLLCGVLGGFVHTVALSLPLLFLLPARYSEHWKLPPPPVPGEAGYLVSLLIGVGTGYVAARWGWASGRNACLKTGMFAGLIAALIAFCLIGAATAGVVGCQPIFLHGARPLASAQETAQAICEATVRIAWKTYLTFWVMSLAGALLGALGGWLYYRQRSGPWGAQPPVIAAEPLDAAVVMLIITALTLVAGIGANAPRLRRAEEYTLNYRLVEPSWPLWGIVGWPVLMKLLILILATWFCGRCWAGRCGSSEPAVRREIRSGMMVLAVLPLVVLGPCMLYVAPFLYGDPVFLAGAAMWLAVSIFSVGRIWRGQTAMETRAPACLPPHGHRLLVNAGLLVVLIPPLVMLAGASNVFTYYLAVSPFVDIPLGQPAPANALPTPGETIPQIYAIHVLYTTYKAVAWIALAGLHAATVRWRAKTSHGLRGTS